jgi:hypothetical protein
VVTERKWIDHSQPQTLQAAVILSYMNAALGVLSFVVSGGAGLGGALLALLVVLGAAAYGVANERRWAYRVAVGAAGVYLGIQIVAFFVIHDFAGVLNLVFAGVLLALLVHAQSRAYQRIWFH